MRAAAWLAWREIGARLGRLALASAVVAAVVALCAGVELLARAREGAVAARIDEIGPPLRIVPAGVTAGALARLDLEGSLLPPGLADEVHRAVPGLRLAEARLVLEMPVAGWAAPVVGVSPGAASEARGLRVGQVALGAALAARVGARAGDEVTVGGARWRVAAVLASAGSAEDLAAWVPLQALQDLARLPEAVNELRLYLRPGTSAQVAEAALSGLASRVSMVRSDRGEVAERGVPESLRRHRQAGYLVAAAVAALVLAMAAHLDASERRVEMATLVAVGASGATVAAGVVVRSMFVAAAGAIAGFVVGAAVALLQDPGALSLGETGPVAALALLGAAALGVAAAVPVAIAAGLRDPVADLQES
ncbi:MAG TPA: ABC transporter permease [Anaeromyxobacteraceae bacterium]|nr:ABC transporter permease [Anaeromyxobacteraceae bacterium]